MVEEYCPFGLLELLVELVEREREYPKEHLLSVT